jgi:HD-like signal output (HDOD) protein/CheY-like chemotaxis protein
VLFVDDEERVLQGVERAFFCEDDWEVLSATSGKQALELLARESVDVVVSDMRMLVMDGAALLKNVSELYPECIRIILSGHADEAASLRVINVAHQFLNKPCSPEKLKQALTRALLMRSLVEDEGLRVLVSRVDQLPVAPTVFRKLSALLERSDTSPRDIAAVVAHDPALTAKLLQLVNSAFFTRGEPITELLAAVTRLGVRIVRCIALEVGVFRDAKAKNLNLDLDALQATCSCASAIARKLVNAPADQEAAGAAALLADLGILVLAMFQPRQWAELAVAREVPSAAREKEVFGCTHSRLSAYLLALWGLPNPVIHAVLKHHDLLAEPSNTIDLDTAVALAYVIVETREIPAGWAEAAVLKNKVAEITALLGTLGAEPATTGSAARSLRVSR